MIGILKSLQVGTPSGGSVTRSSFTDNVQHSAILNVLPFYIIALIIDIAGENKDSNLFLNWPLSKWRWSNSPPRIFKEGIRQATCKGRRTVVDYIHKLMYEVNRRYDVSEVSLGPPGIRKKTRGRFCMVILLGEYFWRFEGGRKRKLRTMLTYWTSAHIFKKSRRLLG